MLTHHVLVELFMHVIDTLDNLELELMSVRTLFLYKIRYGFTHTLMVDGRTFLEGGGFRTIEVVMLDQDCP